IVPGPRYVIVRMAAPHVVGINATLSCVHTGVVGAPREEADVSARRDGMVRERESMREGADPFEACALAELRQRRSEKWATYPPDVLPAFVAEMDVALADPIRRTLSAAIARGDTGYAHPAGLADAFAAFARAWFAWAVDPARVVLVPDVM